MSQGPIRDGDGSWIDVEDRLPPLGKWVKVWGEFCVPGFAAPVAYRREEPAPPRGKPAWFWSGPHWNGVNGVSWWYETAEDVTPPARPFRPLCGPGDQVVKVEVRGEVEG